MKPVVSSLHRETEAAAGGELFAMKLPFAVFCLFLCCLSPASSETIEVDGASYFNAELVEVCKDGAVYRVEGESSFVTLPWAGLSASQLAAVKAKFSGAMENAKFDACLVKGTVFQITPDGVVVQIDLVEDESGPEFQNGARVLRNGLVIIEDLPGADRLEDGAPVETVAHKQRTFTYDMGIAAKEIPFLTVAKPLWGMEQEWKNTSGQVMTAKLLAVKESKGMFEKAGKRFIVELSSLDEDAQTRAREVEEKLAGFPLP